MFKEVIVEKIDVEEGTLIICRRYMTLQTSDGVLHPADMDNYEMYLPIWNGKELSLANSGVFPIILFVHGNFHGIGVFG